MIRILDIYDKLGWEQAKGYPRGTRMKTLRNDNSAKTVLLKLPKGFHMESHSHITTEQHLIIRGKYESEGKVYSSGTYRLIPVGVDHGPFESKSGAVILVVWDPLIKKGHTKS